MKKNLFFTLCFSFIPGAGQMYQGYMKRGLSIMILAGFFLAIATITSTDLFIIPIPIIIAYSFFDTFNIRNKFNINEKENAKEKDIYIWNTDLFEGIEKFNFSKKNYLVGIMLILIGIYIFTNKVLYGLARMLDLEIFDYISTLVNYMPPIFIAVTSIYCGIKLISRK